MRQSSVWLEYFYFNAGQIKSNQEKMLSSAFGFVAGYNILVYMVNFSRVCNLNIMSQNLILAF